VPAIGAVLVLMTLVTTLGKCLLPHRQEVARPSFRALGMRSTTRDLAGPLPPESDSPRLELRVARQGHREGVRGPAASSPRNPRASSKRCSHCVGEIEGVNGRMVSEACPLPAAKAARLTPAWVQPAALGLGLLRRSFPVVGTEASAVGISGSPDRCLSLGQTKIPLDRSLNPTLAWLKWLVRDLHHIEMNRSTLDIVRS